MKIKDFEKYLTLWGTNLNDWPDEMKIAAEKHLKESNEFQEFVNEQKELENFLHLRKFEPSDEDVIRQIVLQAKTEEYSKSHKTILESPLDLLFLFLPIKKLAWGFAVVFLLGFFLGLLPIEEQESLSETDIVSFLSSEGDLS